MRHLEETYSLLWSWLKDGDDDGDADADADADADDFQMQGTNLADLAMKAASAAATNHSS